MAKYNAHTERFNVGEYDTAGLTRLDLKDTRLSAEIQENVMPHEVGKGQVRPGTTYLGRSHYDLEARLVPFARTPTEKALLEMTRYNLRVWVDDALVTRNEVDCVIANDSFQESGTSGPIYNPLEPSGWSLRTETGSFISVPGDGSLYMGPNNQGTKCFAQHAGTTGSPGVEHAVRVVVARGPVSFKIGSTPDAQDLFAETYLDTGVHSLAFTPYGSFYIRFTCLAQKRLEITECSIEEPGIMTIDAPWSEDDIWLFNFEQSADVIFCANKNLKQLKLERRGDTSWSVAYYETYDGPFTDPQGAGEVSVSVSNSYQGYAVTSTYALDPLMEGSLIRTFHDRLYKVFSLSAENTWTDPWRVTGIVGKDFNDRRFTWTLLASGAHMTITMQRSISGENGDYIDAPRDDGTSTTNVVLSGGTVNNSYDHKGEEEDNNLEAYHRVGIKPGDYTSGSAGITVTYQGDSGYGTGYLRNVLTDGKEFEIEWLERPNSDGVTKAWEVGAWSDYYGWPSAVAIYDNRLWWGRNDRVWASANGDFYSYDDTSVTSTATIERKIATGGASSKINWLVPLQRLIAGTASSEVSLRSNAVGEVLTQDNISVKDASSYGSSTVSPVRIDSRGVYIHRTGEKAMLLDYNGQARDYTSTGLNDFNDTILQPGVQQLAVQRQPETYVWAVRKDGQVPFLLMKIDEEGNPLVCWARFVTEGDVESIAVLPDTEQDAVYMSVKRPLPTEPDTIIETRSDEMAAPYKQVTAFSFLDGSVTVKDSADPSRNYRGTQLGHYTAEDGATLNGPNGYWASWSGWLGHDHYPIYTRQADGTYKRPFYNQSYDIERMIGEEDQGFTEWSRGAYPFGTQLGLRVQGADFVAEDPYGQMRASKLSASTTDTIEHFISNYMWARSTTYYWDRAERNISICLKAAEHSTCDIWFCVINNSSSIGPNSTNILLSTNNVYLRRYHVDLVNGTLSKYYEQSDAGTGEEWIDFVSPPVVTDKGNGWFEYKWRVVIRSNGTYGDPYFGISLKRDNGDLLFAGDTQEGIYAWGYGDQVIGTPDDDALWPTRNYQDNNTWPQNDGSLPYEWDEDGNPLGVRIHDAVAQVQTYPVVGAMGGFPISDGIHTKSRRYWPASITNGIVQVIDGNYAPDRANLAGRMVNNTAGGSGAYTGIRQSRYNGSDFDFYGRSMISIFVRHTGGDNYRYFTLSQVLTNPTTTDEWYSTTFDLVDGVITEEFHQEGSGSWTPSTQGFHTVRQCGIEAFADGWYRIWNKAWTDDFQTGYVYWCPSVGSTPGATTHGVETTSIGSTTGKTVDVCFYLYQINDHTVHSKPAPIRGPGYSQSSGAYEWMPSTVMAPFSPVVPFQYGEPEIYSWHGALRPSHTLDKDYFTQYLKFKLIDVNDVLTTDPDYAVEFPMPEYGQVNTPTMGAVRGFDIDKGMVTYACTTISPANEITMGVVIDYEPDYPGTAYAYEGTKQATPGETYTTWCSVAGGATSFKLDGITYGQRSSPAFDLADNYNFRDQLTMTSWYSYYGFVDYYCEEVMVANTLLPDEPRYIERLAKHSEAKGEQINKMADAGVYHAGPVSSVTLPHLSDRDDIVAWGTRVSDGKAVPVTGLVSDIAGNIDLGDTYTDIFIGIEYTARYKSGKLAYAGSGGTALTQPKRVSELGLILSDVHRDAVSYGPDFERMRKMNIVSKGRTTPEDTVLDSYDDNRFSFPGTWDTDSRLCLKVSAPYPCTFLGLVVGVETNSKGGS